MPSPPSDAHPEHPIVIVPPDSIAPGVPTHPIYLPVYPAHPIAPGGSPGVPTHPIYNPPSIWGPPTMPPGFWGGGMGPGVKPQPRPEHPIALPPGPPDGGAPPAGGGAKPPPPGGGWGYHPEYGWGYFPPSSDKPQPGPPATSPPVV